MGGIHVTVAAILLAGGESARMGTPKPLLEWGGSTLIEYQLAQLKAAPIDHVLVVVGHGADEVRPYMETAGVAYLNNEQYRQGRASSLRLAAAALPQDTQAVLILNVDQPRPHAVLERLVQEHLHLGNLITVPTYEGRRGHPPVLSGRLIPELREVSEESQGLRAIIHRHQAEVFQLPFDTPVVLLDINRPQEYQRARAAYFP